VIFLFPYFIQNECAHGAMSAAARESWGAALPALKERQALLTKNIEQSNELLNRLHNQVLDG
jgi:hypothetical protein